LRITTYVAARRACVSGFHIIRFARSAVVAGVIFGYINRPDNRRAESFSNPFEVVQRGDLLAGT
jgi:hypothetical protein